MSKAAYRVITYETRVYQVEYIVPECDSPDEAYKRARHGEEAQTEVRYHDTTEVERVREEKLSDEEYEKVRYMVED